MKQIAQRLYDLVPEWDREGLQEVIDTLNTDPLAVVKYLLDYIDEMGVSA